MLEHHGELVKFHHETEPCSSTGSPITLKIRPNVGVPTGTLIGVPKSKLQHHVLNHPLNALILHVLCYHLIIVELQQCFCTIF
jgi:hypothetical protein